MLNCGGGGGGGGLPNSSLQSLYWSGEIEWSNRIALNCAKMRSHTTGTFLFRGSKGIGGGSGTASTAIAIPILQKLRLSRTKVVAVHTIYLTTCQVLCSPEAALTLQT